jgi:hypothetical protein
MHISPPPGMLGGGGFPMPPMPTPMMFPPSSVGIGSGTQPPSEALYGAYLANNAMLLDFITQSLTQVKLLVEQQKEMAIRFEEHRAQQAATAAAANNLSLGAPMTAASSSSSRTPVVVEDEKEDGAAQGPLSSVLHQRRSVAAAAQQSE